MRTPVFALIASLLWPAAGAAQASLEPVDQAAFDYDAAKHLLARAGFGGTPEEIREIAALGPKGAVDYLVDYEELPSGPAFAPAVTSRPDRSEIMGKSEEERKKLIQEYRQRDRRQFEAVRTWWIRRMIDTDRPLEEKMTLFWHGHFTSSMREVKDSYHMLLQNELLRRLATGNFRTLVHAIAKDPAMLAYLNNDKNRKGRPNENFARELMELFTMGVGNYNEQDIKEAARAFTGWSFERNQFISNPRQHDSGKKTVLGRTGDLNGDDVIETILEQPVTAEFISRKLFAFLAHDDPDEAVVKALAKEFRDAKYEIKPLLKTILLSKEFYGDRSRGSKIKSPIELVVGTSRSLGLRADALARVADFAATQMGQSLFDPPNVKGWEGGRSWISTSTLYRRYNFAGVVTGAVSDAAPAPGRYSPKAQAFPEPNQKAVARAEKREAKRGGESRPATEGGEAMRGEAGEGAEPGEPGEMRREPPPPADGFGREMLRNFAQIRLKTLFDPLAVAKAAGAKTAADVVDVFAKRCLVKALTPESRTSLIEFLDKDANGGGAAFDPLRPDADQKIREMLHLMMSTPEYQLT